MRLWVHWAAAVALGASVASAGWAALRPRTPAFAPVRSEPKPPLPPDDDALARANQNLVRALQECDRKLAEVRDAPAVSSASPVAEAPPEPRDGGRAGRRRERGEPSREDWERMAQLGVVRVRVPCVRDKPWEPPQRVIDRLGLSPADAGALKEAYERSNKRVLDAVRPLCAQALGSPDAVDRFGASVCMDAIANSARKTTPDQTREALTRVAEVQAGKRAAPGRGGETPAAIEQLALALSGESRAFEADLAQRLGPDEAKRLASAPELCSDRRVFRGGADREER